MFTCCKRDVHRHGGHFFWEPLWASLRLEPSATRRICRTATPACMRAPLAGQNDERRPASRLRLEAGLPSPRRERVLDSRLAKDRPKNALSIPHWAQIARAI